MAMLMNGERNEKTTKRQNNKTTNKLKTENDMNILDKALKVAKCAACAAVVLTGFYYASRMDYEDAVLNEMKNNGTYYAMSQEHPDWDEAEMVKEYTEWKEKNEECRWSDDR
nr:MAG TPA: hypothetical protein [Caudoviricetes sp.]